MNKQNMYEWILGEWMDCNERVTGFEFIRDLMEVVQWVIERVMHDWEVQK